MKFIPNNWFSVQAILNKCYCLFLFLNNVTDYIVNYLQLVSLKDIVKHSRGSGRGRLWHLTNYFETYNQRDLDVTYKKFMIICRLLYIIVTIKLSTWSLLYWHKDQGKDTSSMTADDRCLGTYSFVELNLRRWSLRKTFDKP